MTIVSLCTGVAYKYMISLITVYQVKLFILSNMHYAQYDLEG